MEWKQCVEKTNNLTIVNLFKTIFWRSLILLVGTTDNPVYDFRTSDDYCPGFQSHDGYPRLPASLFVNFWEPILRAGVWPIGRQVSHNKVRVVAWQI